MNAIDQNKCGINMMKLRRYESAIASFSHGLQGIRDRMSGLEQAETFASSRSCRSAAGDPQCLFLPEKIYNDEPNDGQAFIFKDPFQIYLRTGTPDYGTLTQLSFILLFNLGLAYQLLALETNSSLHLQKSLRLYELAGSVKRQEEFELDVLHVMALLNNVGLLHGQLHNEEKANICFQNLTSLVFFHQQQQHEQESEQSVNLTGFANNIIPFLVKTSKPAAPAA